MYHEFIQWATDKVNASGAVAEKGNSADQRTKREKEVREEALDCFGKRETLEARVRERTKRSESKEVWSGSRVRDWADMGEYWLGVKAIMDGVRERYGGDEGVREIYDREGEEGVKRVVMQVKEEVLVKIDGKYVKKVDALALGMNKIVL